MLYAQPTDKSKHLVDEIEEKAKTLENQWKKNSFQDAVQLYQNAASKWEVLEKFDRAINCIHEASKLKLHLAENESAILLLTKSLKLADKHKLKSESAKTLSYLSLAYLKIGKTKDSKKYLDKSLEVSRKANDSLAQALSFYSAGEYFYLQNDFSQANQYYLNAHNLWQKTNNKKQQAQAGLGLAYSYFATGLLRDALNYANESENIFSELQEKRGLALSRIAIGHILSSLNKKQLALEMYDKANQGFPDSLDLLEKGALLNGFGAIYEDYEKYEISLEYRLKALNAFQQDNYPSGQLSTMHSIIGLNSLLGNNSKAEFYIKEAQKLSKILNESFFISLVYKRIADSLFKSNQDSQALVYYLSSLKEAQKVNFKENIILIKTNIGRIYHRNNQFNEARKYFFSALSMSKDIKFLFAQAEINYQLAVFENSLENEKESFVHLKESIENTETLYSDVANSNLQRTYFSNVYDRYELYIHLLMQKNKASPSQGFAIQALQISEKSRSRSLLETLRLSEANFTKDANPELLAKEKELRNLLTLRTTILTDLLSSKAENSEIEKVETEIRSLEHDLENIKAELKQKSPVYSAIKNPLPFDVAEFQKNILDEKTVLLEFSLGERESYLWLVSKNEVTSYILPPRNKIEEKVDKIHQSFEKRQPKPNEEIEVYQQRLSEAETEFKQESKLLSHDLLSQVIDKLKDKRLIVVPDGKLAILPLSTLNVPNTETPLILQNEIVYEPSASLLNILANLRVQKKMPTKDLLVFADPVFSETDSRLNLKHQSTETNNPSILDINLRDFRLMDENGRIPRLFATKNEADSIANVIGESSSSIASGFDANRERVTNSDINDYRILHFATHGLIDVKRPEISSIVLSQFDEDGNKREGFLRLQDIYALDLATDLVVLSACQSGVGKEIKGEGLMSLNNAFLQAGAKSVLSSAWKVDDSATAELMKYFYENLSRKQMPPGQALREAQIKLQQNPQFSSPFYWATFTIQGEFKQPISIKQQTHYFYYFAFTVLIILFGGLGWKFRKKLSYRT